MYSTIEVQEPRKPAKIENISEVQSHVDPKLTEVPKSEPVQKTLTGMEVTALPKVRTTDGHLMEWDRETIVKQLLKETKLSEQFYGIPSISEEEAKEIARETEKRIRAMGVKFLSGPLVRELVNIILLERNHPEWRNMMTRVGTPVYDAYKIDMGTGFEAKDNANLQENAETSHKKKADKISKEQYLLLLPPRLADAHLNGDIHIHDLEYLGTRCFCIDESTAIPVKSGDRMVVLRPDELSFEGEYYYPENLFAITPKGYRRIEKISRREVKKGEMLKIRTSSGRSLKITREHKIPVKEKGMVIKRAEEVKEGDVLHRADDYDGFSIRGGNVSTIDLIKELTEKVPAPLLENVFARNLRPIFEEILVTGRSRFFSEISEMLGVEHRKEWFTRGIMPITLFRRLCDLCDLKDYAHVRVGVMGSEHDLPAVLPITSKLVKLLGLFVSEGNYNVTGDNYNLVITENQHASTMQQYAVSTLNTYATMIDGGSPITKIIGGIEGEWERARQVYFGGKLAYLLFRYVFGITGGSDKKRLPNIAYNLNDKLLHDFLSALFTGDGSAYYRPEKSDCIVNYTTTSEMLRQELSLLLISLGMHPQIVVLPRDEEKRTLYRVQLNGRRNIEIFSRYVTFYNDNQDHIDRFLATVKEITKSRKPEVVTEVFAVEPSGRHVYDVFLERGVEEEDHTLFVSDGLLIHNCQDWDLRYFFYYGLMPDGSGTKASVAGPAKKPEVAILHAVKALGSAQTNFAGGQGFYNFLTFLAPYLEGLSYNEIEQLMQMFVYEMTQMMVARGGQLVFSSVQLSPGVPKLWRDKPVVYKGKVWDGVQAPKRTYGEFEREVRLAFEALMRVMLKGDYWGKPFNFPKPEISIEPDFLEEDLEYNRAHPELLSYDQLYTLAFELAAKYGAPYFDNQLPEYRGAGKGISCYQCLAEDELIPVVNDGALQVRHIEELFKNAAKNGLSLDPNGVEFAEFRGSTPSINFETFKASLREFSGVMRKRYKGRLLNIVLNTGRRIKVTPDHPVFVFENRAFTRKLARELKLGEFMPVLKNADFGLTPIEKLADEGDVHPLKIKSIEKEDYDGYVYDLVDVSGTHNFCNGLGVIAGNCCAYNFSSSHERDSSFEDKLYFREGKHFSMGAWQVVSLNCPRAAYKAKGNDEDLFRELKRLMDVAVELFKVKRRWMDKILENNRMPFATQRPKDPTTGKRGEIAVDLSGLVYTIGVVGINEMVQHHTGKQMHESEEAKRLAIRAMYEMKFYAKELSEKHGIEIALARTPAETTAQRFAVSDLLHKEYRNCVEPIVKGDVNIAIKKLRETRDLPVYYTNGTHVPPGADISLIDRINIEHVFFPIVDGGNILHIWLGEASPDPQGLKEFAMNIAKNTQTGYFAFTKDMTVCMNDYHVAPGLLENCPNCESENVEHLSRVTGYIQAVEGWNEGKKQELKDRKRYGIGMG